MLWKKFNEPSVTMAAPLTAGPWLAGPQAPVKGQLTPAGTFFSFKINLPSKKPYLAFNRNFLKAISIKCFYSISKMTYL